MLWLFFLRKGKRMKKILLLLLFVFVISGCEARKSEFVIAMANMDDLTSVEMTITMQNVPIFGSLTGNIKLDNEKTETTFFGDTSYAYTEDGVEYELFELHDHFYSQEVEVTEEDLSELGMFEDFNGLKEEDFTYEDGTYVAKDTILEMDDLVITIEEEYVTIIEFTVTEEMLENEVTLTIIIEFDEYNTTEVTLPAYETVTDYVEGLLYFDNQFYSFEETETGFTLSDFGTTIEYNSDDNLFYFSTWGEEATYDYENDEITWEDFSGTTTDTLQNYLDTVTFPIISEAEAEALSLIITGLE